MVNNPVVHALKPQDLERARDMFTERINSLENDTNRCFYGIFEPGAPGPAFFPAIMYCFATLDYFSSFWAGWNQRAPQGQSQTDRMVAFGERYLLYPRKEAQIAIHFWRHKLMHTAEPRPLRDSVTNEAYCWSTGSVQQNPCNTTTCVLPRLVPRHLLYTSPRLSSYAIFAKEFLAPTAISSNLALKKIYSRSIVAASPNLRATRSR